jgi:hypothetical protein
MDDVWKALTALIGFSAFAVGLAQWRTASEKLRLDLFERRYKIFGASKVFLASIFHSGRVSPQALYEFNTETKDAVFLFQSDVVEYLEALNEKAARLQYLRERTDTGPGDVNLGYDEDDPPPAPPNAEERAQLQDEIQSVHAWAGDQLTDGRLQRAFLHYLQFKDRGVWVTAVLIGLAIILGVSLAYLRFRDVPPAAAAEAAVVAPAPQAKPPEVAPPKIEQALEK